MSGKPLSVTGNILARPHKNGCFATEEQYMAVVLQKSVPQDWIEVTRNYRQGKYFRAKNSNCLSMSTVLWRVSFYLRMVFAIVRFTLGYKPKNAYFIDFCFSKTWLLFCFVFNKSTYFFNLRSLKWVHRFFLYESTYYWSPNVIVKRQNFT